MLIKNPARNAIIAQEAEFYEGILPKFMGMMFSAKPKPLVFRFEKENAIHLHMFFVFFPIDVLFLNRKKIVVDKKENFRPFNLYSSKKKAVYAVELPKDSIRKSKTSLGDKLVFLQD